MELFLLLAVIYFVSYFVGRYLERIKIPWLFSSLFLGILFSLLPKKYVPHGDVYNFLAELGMLLMLFLIGMELDLDEMFKVSGFILKATAIIILFDALTGTVLISSFGYPLFISLIVAMSFATVGEAILIPILDEEKIVNTRLGRLLIGIGTLDDVIEVITIFLASFVLSKGNAVTLLPEELIAFFSMLLALYFVSKEREIIKKFLKVPEMEELFAFSLSLLFIFLALGVHTNTEVIGALIAGMIVKNMLLGKSVEHVENHIKFMIYGFFAPIFFFWVGSTVNLYSIAYAPLLTLAILLVSISAKVFGSMFVSRGEMNKKESFLLGVGLSVRFSSGIVVSKLLYTYKLIDVSLYSALVAASMLSTLTMPLAFNYLLRYWKKEIRS